LLTINILGHIFTIELASYLLNNIFLYLVVIIHVNEKRCWGEHLSLREWATRGYWKFITRVYPKVSGLAAWSENCKWYSSLALDAVVSLFYESVW
jgi:hypothetical protein